MKKQKGFIAWLIPVIVAEIGLLLGVIAAFNRNNFEAVILGVSLIITIAYFVWKEVTKIDDEDKATTTN